MTLNDFATRVAVRKAGDTKQIDPMTILALIAAAIQIGKMIYRCYLDRQKKDIVADYRSWTPLGWLRRSRVRHAVEAEGLSADYAEAIVDEIEAIGTGQFHGLVKEARMKGNY